ncbi:MAG TPA: DMT family transporter [Nitrososphaerales archaeon]|nr:DMT family transporter [Nitrososphaerales archaeon]
MQGQLRPVNTTLAKWLIPYVIIASLQYQFTKDGLSYASPFVLMSFRYVFTGVIFYFLGGRKIPLDRDALLVAGCSSVSTLTWAVGLSYVSPGDSAVLSYTMPLFSIPIAIVVIRERVLRRELMGALVGFGGVIVYSLTLSHGSELLGAFYTLVGAVFWAVYSVYYRKLRSREPIPILTTQFLVGSIPGAVGCLFFPQISPGISLLVDVAYLAIFSGVALFVLWNGLLRRGRVGRITTMAFAVPAMTILVDSVRTLSLPSALAVLGGVMMFIGVFIANWSRDSENAGVNAA